MYANFDEFDRYGKVLMKHFSENTEMFRTEGATGWRVAELPIYDRTVVSMSLHDNTPEAFFPIEGVTALTVASDSDFSDAKTFLLDRPVVINAGVWHGLCALTEMSRIMVLENGCVNLINKPYPAEGK